MEYSIVIIYIHVNYRELEEHTSNVPNSIFQKFF